VTINGNVRQRKDVRNHVWLYFLRSGHVFSISSRRSGFRLLVATRLTVVSLAA
jgi:hypothetical protein